MDANQIRTLFEAQKAYFLTGATRGHSFRIAQLRRLDQMIRENEDAILAALTQDLGRCDTESYIAEINFLYSELKHSIKHLRHWMQPRKTGTPAALQPAQSMVIYEPLGVTLNISPWNYPFQLLFAPVIGAVSAGNTMILKPSELAPAISKISAELVAKYFDPNLVAVVEGAIAETTALLELPFDHIFYTGSTNVGKIVMAAAAKNLTPVTLELGGKSPCIVDKNTDLTVTARRITWGKFYNAGQTCVAPDYLLVHESVKEPLIREIKAQITEFYGPNPKDSPDYPRIINERHFQRLSKLIDKSKVIAGGDGDASQKYMAPTLLDNVKPDDAVMADEIFGPILPILTWSDLSEAIRFVRSRPKPLALYVYTKDNAVAQRVLDEVSFGGGIVNDCMVHLANFNLPFGGVGHSGLGAYHGKDGFDVFSHKKAVMKRKFAFDLKFRYPPYKLSLDTWRKLLKYT